MTATKEQQNQRQNQPQQDEVGSCLSLSVSLSPPLFSSSCSYLVFFHPTLPPSPSRALTMPRLDAAFFFRDGRPAK